MVLPKMPHYRPTLLRLGLVSVVCVCLAGVLFYILDKRCGRLTEAAPIGAYSGPVHVIEAHWLPLEWSDVIRLQHIYYVCGGAALFMGIGLGLATNDKKWFLFGIESGLLVAVLTVGVVTWLVVLAADGGGLLVAAAVPGGYGVQILCCREETCVEKIKRMAIAGAAAWVVYYLGIMALWWILDFLVGFCGLDAAVDTGALAIAGWGRLSWLHFGIFTGYHTFCSGYVLALLDQEFGSKTTMKVLWPFDKANI